MRPGASLWFARANQTRLRRNSRVEVLPLTAILARVPERPATKRGAETRRSLVCAARAVFERDGFLDARITDIAKEAGAAHGTFYTYFRTKGDVFREVVRSLEEDREHVQPNPIDDLWPKPLAAVARANRAYMETYRRNARMMAIIEQVATFNDEMRAIRHERTLGFVRKVAAMIVRVQAEGLADTRLDPYYAATALTAMVSRFTYLMFVQGEDLEFEKAVWTLTRMWASALGIDGSPPPLNSKARLQWSE